MEGTPSQNSSYLAGMLFIYISFKLVEILDFDCLVLSCCFFFMLNKVLNVVDCVMNDTV